MIEICMRRYSVDKVHIATNGHKSSAQTARRRRARGLAGCAGPLPALGRRGTASEATSSSSPSMMPRRRCDAVTAPADGQDLRYVIVVVV